MPPSSATIRGIAGPTIVWLMEATSMPRISPMKTRLACGSRWNSGTTSVGGGATGAAVAISERESEDFTLSTLEYFCSVCKFAWNAAIVEV